MDVTSLVHRRATHRWERVSVGDMLERLTWSYPDKDAIVGWDGAYADPAFARVTYRRADRVANQVANGLLARGLARGDQVLLCCENSVEAVVIPTPGNPADESELLAFCRDRLAGFESPKRVLFTDSLPETVGGKVLKYKLRQEYTDLYR